MDLTFGVIFITYAKIIIYNKILDIGNFISSYFIFFSKLEVQEKTQGFIPLIYELKNKLKLNI